MKINKLIVSSVAALALSTVLFADGHATHWGYTGHEGPANWGDLDEKYTMCKLGINQSPINISKDVEIDAVDLKPIAFNYVTGASEVINNGHTIQVNIKEGSSITIDGIEFSLKQFHFHTPSENQIEGKNFPLEAHFVHASKDGQLAVVAVMLEDGVENPLIKQIWKKMPHKGDEKNGCGLSSKQINDFLPKNKDYYRFSGSLTTPPCSEGVRWLVMKNYSTISTAQTKEFSELFHGANNRPVQAIGARKVAE
ncbi:MAG: carbonic anhydrase family protein [Sulfurimonas sp.]|nr:carbonic anhydrase family protein [Sulfurimonas sp.]